MPHPEGPATHPEGTTREFYRRASDELWPLIATVSGTGYAFDEDPDGAYADEDRALRKLLEERSWPERAAELRLGGVTHVLADEPVPYREVAVLNDVEGRAPLRRGRRAAVRALRHARSTTGRRSRRSSSSTRDRTSIRRRKRY